MHFVIEINKKDVVVDICKDINQATESAHKKKKEKLNKNYIVKDDLGKQYVVYKDGTIEEFGGSLIMPFFQKNGRNIQFILWMKDLIKYGLKNNVKEIKFYHPADWRKYYNKNYSPENAFETEYIINNQIYS